MRHFLTPSGSAVDFSRPYNEEALFKPASVSWQIYKNPVVLYTGGVAAVLLELAEPSICAALWQRSSFKRDPVGRLRRTALAAMVTIYGPRSIAEQMIARVNRMHAAIEGSEGGKRYSASDPILLSWVQATATFSFAEAYNRYVTVLPRTSIDAIYREAEPGARLFGAQDMPTSAAAMSDKFASMESTLRTSTAIFEFLGIMNRAAILPGYAKWLQRLLTRAAVDLVPLAIRRRLGLSENCGLRPGERHVICAAARLAERLVITNAPPVQACLRLGLPSAFLYR